MASASWLPPGYSVDVAADDQGVALVLLRPDRSEVARLDAAADGVAWSYVRVCSWAWISLAIRTWEAEQRAAGQGEGAR